MSAQYDSDSREMTILETQGIQVKNQTYHAVLTSRRIILTGDADRTPRSINLPDVHAIEMDTDNYGNPEIIVSVLSARGEIQRIILHFSLRIFPNADRLRSLWSAEISKIIQKPIQVSSPITPATVSPAPAFCPKCGKRLAEGSFFCDGCGAKILYPFQPLPAEQVYGYSQDQPIQPQISTGTIDLSRKDQAYSATGYPATLQNPPVQGFSRKEAWKKKSFFAGSRLKKTGVVIGVCLAVIIIVAAAFIITTPSGSPGFNLTSTGLNVSLPDLGAVKSPLSPAGNTPTNPETPVSPENPADSSIPVVTSSGLALTFAPEDPGAVMVTYPSLFNNGDSAGIQALLAEDIKSQYSLEDLSNELDVAQSNGYSIENIQVNNQIIQGDSAILIAEISWKTSESPVTRTQNLQLVNENGQWKLNTLILHP